MKLLAAAFTVVLLAVAGCGGAEGGGEQAQATAKLPRPVADDLARRSDAVAQRLEANDPCGALAEAEALQDQTIQVLNERRVPPRYQEELASAVNSLLASIECPVQFEPPPPTDAETHYDEEEEEDDD